MRAQVGEARGGGELGRVIEDDLGLDAELFADPPQDRDIGLDERLADAVVELGEDLGVLRQLAFDPAPVVLRRRVALVHQRLELLIHRNRVPLTVELEPVVVIAAGELHVPECDEDVALPDALKHAGVVEQVRLVSTDDHGATGGRW